MTIVDLRAKIAGDIFSSWELDALLGGYRNKKAKTAALLRGRGMMKLRHGLYAFTPPLQSAPLSEGVIANRLYGTSYVSSDFALSYYGLIPEKVTVVTSISMGRSRIFTTPVGVFSYRYSRSGAYSIGITTAGRSDRRFLIATPEKALFDKVAFDIGFDAVHPERYLTENLRIDPNNLARFDKSVLRELEPFMRGRLRWLYLYLVGL